MKCSGVFRGCRASAVMSPHIASATWLGTLSSRSVSRYSLNVLTPSDGIEAARRTLQHSRWSSTRCYVDKIIPDYVAAAMFGDEADTRMAHRVRTHASKPDAKAPKPADELSLEAAKERLERVRVDPILQALRADQARIKDIVAQSHGTMAAAPPHLRHENSRLTRHYRSRFQRLCEQHFKEIRNSYFDQRTHTVGGRVGRNSGPVAWGTRRGTACGSRSTGRT